MEALAEKYPSLDNLVAFVRSLDADGETPDSEKRFNDLVRRLRSDSALAKDRLQELSAWPGNAVRAWVAASAGAIIGRDALPILEALLGDPDPTVQQIALVSVLSLDRESLRRRLQDGDSLPDLRILSKRSDVPEWLQRNAEIATEYLERGPQAVFERIRSHDHNNVLFSCRLAWRIGSKDAHAALSQCADQAPDGDCRQTCHRFKEALETEWSLHDPPYWDVRLPY
ncbi:MAG: hypothetical protein E6H90_16255 [Chloroflexi bacterium]|nr:MAG: hypothetical protein E6H90_16255 [Chloroflexota bacterium]